MRHWLMKSEPDVFGIDHLKAKGRAPWDGVRNYQARNCMLEMAVGDRVLFYHSSVQPPGVAGLAEVVRTAYPDHTQFDPAGEHFDPACTAEKPRWSMVDVAYVATLPRLVTLDEMRRVPELGDLLLFRRSRLSVLPVSAEQYALIVGLAERPATPAAATQRIPTATAMPAARRGDRKSATRSKLKAKPKRKATRRR